MQYPYNNTVSVLKQKYGTGSKQKITVPVLKQKITVPVLKQKIRYRYLNKNTVPVVNKKKIDNGSARPDPQPRIRAAS